MLFHTSVLSVLILIFFQESVWIRKFIIQNCPMSVSDIQILNLKCPLPYMSLFYWVPASLAQWQSVGLVNQRSWVQSSLEAEMSFFFNPLPIVGVWGGKKLWPRRDSNTQPSDLESDALPLRHGVNMLRFYRDLNSDRWIQSPEC